MQTLFNIFSRIGSRLLVKCQKNYSKNIINEMNIKQNGKKSHISKCALRNYKTFSFYEREETMPLSFHYSMY